MGIRNIATRVKAGRYRSKAYGRRAILPSAAATRTTLLVSDVLMMFLAIKAAVVTTAFLGLAAPASSLARCAPLAALIPLGFWALGLYPSAGMSPVLELRRSTVLVSTVFGIVLSAFALSQVASGTSLAELLFAWLYLLACVPLGRTGLRRLFGRRAWWGMPTLVIGAGKTAELLLSSFERGEALDLKVLGCLDDDPMKRGNLICGTPVVGGLVDAVRLQRAWGIKYGIIAMPGVGPERLAKIVQRHAVAFPHLIVIPNLFGLSSVGTLARDLGGTVGVYGRHNLRHAHTRALKRLMDLVLLLPLSLVALPIVMVAALCVFAVSPGNPFYAQPREGRGRRPLRMWKLRTMYRDSDALLERYLKRNPDARAEWESHFKLKNDPRVLPFIGRALRRTSIDELPQLLNILKGEMSFVGPRPFPYYHLEQFDEDFRQLRASVMPGLTGKWQVSARGTADLATQTQLDSYYVNNWSVWLDVYLLVRTPFAILFGKGTY